jgi:hypothetical protein
MTSSTLRRSFVAVLLAVGLLLVPAASVSAQPSRGESPAHGVFFEPLKALDWLASVWQRLTGLGSPAGAAAKDGACAEDPCGPHTDDGQLIEPDG